MITELPKYKIDIVTETVLLFINLLLFRLLRGRGPGLPGVPRVPPRPAGRQHVPHVFPLPQRHTLPAADLQLRLVVRKPKMFCDFKSFGISLLGLVSVTKLNRPTG